MSRERTWELILALGAAALNFGSRLLDYLRDRRARQRLRSRRRSNPGRETPSRPADEATRLQTAEPSRR